jgi:hypothetical protein
MIIDYLISLVNYHPGPSGIPSPELGAGPSCPFPELPSPFDPLGESNPLPSGIPSPELGAGPVFPFSLQLSLPLAIELPENIIINIRKLINIVIIFPFINIS